MKYPSLSNLIEKLKSSPRVEGIFTIGATATKMNPASDIDLAIILDKNSEGIKSVYTMIENRFSDIFFFDADFLNQLKNRRDVSANNFDGMFVEWLANGKIEYDPENILSALKTKIGKEPLSQKVSDSEKRGLWIKTNYNFIAHSRYYHSADKLYHQALEFRLLYSVIELITAYFSFRDIPWRGEKAAVKYLEQNDPLFFSIFLEYSRSSNLGEKIKHYQRLFERIFFGEYRKWPDDFVIAISNQNRYEPKLASLWDQLIGERVGNDQKRIRAIAVIVHNGNVLLMHRINKGKEYYVFPGGGVETGESIEQAVKREVQEETSLKVAIEKLLYHHIYDDIDNEQFFYLCHYISGKPKLGCANELEEMKSDNSNFYNPLWVKITDLPKTLLYPLEVRDWLIEDIKNNFESIPKKATLKYSELRQTL